jgi:hypothetical protein
MQNQWQHMLNRLKNAGKASNRAEFFPHARRSHGSFPEPERLGYRRTSNIDVVLRSLKSEAGAFDSNEAKRNGLPGSMRYIKTLLKLFFAFFVPLSELFNALAFDGCVDVESARCFKVYPVEACHPSKFCKLF